jgi:hypothetical protein
MCIAIVTSRYHWRRPCGGHCGTDLICEWKLQVQNAGAVWTVSAGAA